MQTAESVPCPPPHAERENRPLTPRFVASEHKRALGEDRHSERRFVTLSRSEAAVTAKFCVWWMQHARHRFQLLDAGYGPRALSHRLQRAGYGSRCLRPGELGGRRRARRGGPWRRRSISADRRSRQMSMPGRLWQMLDLTQQPKMERRSMSANGLSDGPEPGIRSSRADPCSASPFEGLQLHPEVAARRPGRRSTSVDKVRPARAPGRNAHRAQATGMAPRSCKMSSPGTHTPRASHGSAPCSTSRPTLRDTRSLDERRLLRLLREAELPLPVTNVTRGRPPRRRALARPEARGRVRWLAVTTVNATASRPMRLRDQHLAATGHQAIRITARQIDRPAIRPRSPAWRA